MKLLDEEMDGVASEQRLMLESIDGELEDVKKQLGRVWNFIARSDSVDVPEASDLIVELRERKEKLEIAAEEARALLKDRRQFLDSADVIATFAEDMSEFLSTSELTETRAFVHSFVKKVGVRPGKATIVYTIPISQSTQKNCVTLGRWTWTRLEVIAPRPPVSRVPIANPRQPIPKSSSCHPSCSPTGKTSVEDSSRTW